MWIITLAIGIAIGWLIPQPQVNWEIGNLPQPKTGLLAWLWKWGRDKIGLN